MHLPKTGWLVLSGDAIHFKDNWDNKRVASMNTSADQTLASLKHFPMIADKKAGLINHDKPQSRAQKRSPHSTTSRSCPLLRKARSSTR